MSHAVQFTLEDADDFQLLKLCGALQEYVSLRRQVAQSSDGGSPLLHSQVAKTAAKVLAIAHGTELPPPAPEKKRWQR